jgi:hypothetical protein
VALPGLLEPGVASPFLTSDNPLLRILLVLPLPMAAIFYAFSSLGWSLGILIVCDLDFNGRFNSLDTYLLTCKTESLGVLFKSKVIYEAYDYESRLSSSFKSFTISVIC